MLIADAGLDRAGTIDRAAGRRHRHRHRQRRATKRQRQRAGGNRTQKCIPETQAHRPAHKARRGNTARASPHARHQIPNTPRDTT
jgi:hypothetical protein